jgi:hypothetical protein
MNPWLILAAAIALAGLTGGAYVKGREDGENKIVAQEAREREIAAEAVDAANTAAAQAIAGIKVQHRTVTQEVQREVIDRPVYRECLHSPDGLRNINAALTGIAKPEPAGSGVMP